MTQGDQGTPKKSKGFMHKLKKMLGMNSATAGSGPTLKKGSKEPALGKGSTNAQNQDDAMKEIARRSALVKTSMQSNRSAKSTDIMGDLTDDFHRLKETAQKAKAAADEPPAPAKKAEVWD